MELTATGTAVNFGQGTEVPFTIQFDLAGGSLTTAGCDSALMGASITDFSAVIGGTQFAAPSSFLANLTSSPYPSCTSATQMEFTSTTPNVTLSWQDYANPAQHGTFTGNVGQYYIGSGNYSISGGATQAPELSVTEPSGLILLAGAMAILLAHRSHRVRSRPGGNR